MDELFLLGSLLGSLFLFLVVLWGLFSFFIALWVVCTMAKKRGRSVAGWVLISLFLITPFLAMLYLACLGETGKQEDRRIYNEEMIRERVRRGEPLD
jgi:hypothetical protein